jgi:hypothetical protein
MRILRGQWFLIFVLIMLFVVGVSLILSARETATNVRFNLGIELTGAAISVLLIELMVSQYIEGREASRRRPLLSIVIRRLGELVEKAVEELKVIGINVDSSIGTPKLLLQILDADRLNESFSPDPNRPQRKIPRMLQFATSVSFTRKALLDLYDIVRFDLPPEIASAILAVISVDHQRWTKLNPPHQGVDANWIADRQELLFNHCAAVKELRKQLHKLRSEMGDGR